MKLAAQFGITSYPNPAGGCLLAEPNFGRRFSDLVSHLEEFNMNDLLMLKYGRHFRIADHCKLVVGKNQEECEYLKRIPWGNVTIDVRRPTGPFARMKCDETEEYLQTAIEIVARYTSSDTEFREVELNIGTEEKNELKLYRGIPNNKNSDRMLIR
jgi:hypothetical protein